MSKIRTFDRNNAKAHSESSFRVRMNKEVSDRVKIEDNGCRSGDLHTCVSLHHIKSHIREVLLQSPLNSWEFRNPAIVHELSLMSELGRLSRSTEEDPP